MISILSSGPCTTPTTVPVDVFLTQPTSPCFLAVSLVNWNQNQDMHELLSLPHAGSEEVTLQDLQVTFTKFQSLGNKLLLCREKN